MSWPLGRRIMPLLAVTLCAAASNSKNAHDSRPIITIYTRFVCPQHSKVAFEEMKRELAAIWEPIGLLFEWRSVDSVDERQVSLDLVVITFKGQCVDDYIAPSRRPVGPLGWTHMTDGAILPFCDIDCTGIRQFIRSRLLEADDTEREKLMGRAMARVLAHELYHVFSNTSRHAGWGVAKEYYTPRELLEEVFRFHKDESRSLRNGKVEELLRNRRAWLDSSPERAVH